VQVIPNYRQIYEVGNWDKAQTVSVPGQSGHPFARTYDDQLPMWREGAYHLMPWHRPAVDKVAVTKLLLVRG
jgi:penicillin amidase